MDWVSIQCLFFLRFLLQYQSIPFVICNTEMKVMPLGLANTNKNFNI